MPSYNHDKYIAEGIESVLGQTYRNWGLIIVDDGSTDGSLEVIKGYVDQYPDRISLYTHPNHNNRGLKHTYLLGLEKTKGDYIAFLESDDIFFPDSLKERVGAFQMHPDVGLVHSEVEMFGPESKWFQYLKEKLKECPRKSQKCTRDGLYREELLKGNFIYTFSCVMLRKNILTEECFDVPDEYVKWFDYWVWTNLSLKTKFYYLPEKTVQWRIHQGSQNSKLSESDIRNDEKKYKKFLELLQKKIV